MRLEQDPRKVQNALSICASNKLDHFDDAHYITLFDLCFTAKLETGKIISLDLYNVYSHHDPLVYPPKIYFPTLIIVTVGPLPSHRE